MKKIFAISLAIVLIGAVAFVIPLAASGWDFSILNTSSYNTKTYEITDAVSSISINIDTADITFVTTDSDTARVECFEKENLPHSVTVDNGVLNISYTDNTKWYDYISLGVDNTHITVYLPSGAYDALSISASTGDITIPQGFEFNTATVSLSTGDTDFSANVSGDLVISASTGDVEVSNLASGTLAISTSTGDIEISNVSVSGGASVTLSTGSATVENSTFASLYTKGSTGELSISGGKIDGELSIERSTGDTKLSNFVCASLVLNCDTGNVDFDSFDTIGNITVETTTGNVKGTLLSPKIFIHKTSTGKVDLPETTEGGVCKITTSTGNIKISIP